MVTLIAVSLITSLAAFEGAREPSKTGEVVDHAGKDAATEACEAKVLPELHGDIRRWQRTDEYPGERGAVLIFVADVGGSALTYRCEFTPSETTIFEVGSL